MFRYLERSENTARLIETGFRIALTHPGGDEWQTVLQTAASDQLYASEHGEIEQATVIEFLLRGKNNPSSVLNCIAQARQNARLVRTSLTREVWEAVNDTYMKSKQALSRPVRERDLPEVLALIRQQAALNLGGGRQLWWRLAIPMTSTTSAAVIVRKVCQGKKNRIGSVTLA